MSEAEEGAQEYVEEWSEELFESGDRACAIVGQAALEDLVHELLYNHFRGTDRQKTGLLDQTGPVSTFAAQIDLAHAIGSINDAEMRSLHLIRRIRNEFAHESRPLSFDHPPIADRCREMRTWKLSDTEDGLIPEDPRSHFVANVLWLMVSLWLRARHVEPASAPTPLGELIGRTVQDILQEWGQDVRALDEDEFPG